MPVVYKIGEQVRARLLGRILADGGCQIFRASEHRGDAAGAEKQDNKTEKEHPAPIAQISPALPCIVQDDQCQGDEQADEDVQAQEGGEADDDAADEQILEARFRNGALEAVDGERKADDQIDIRVGRVGGHMLAKAKDDCAHGGQPTIAKEIVQIDISAQSNRKDNKEIGQIEGA